MDYSNVKLGFIDMFKVWRAKRVSERRKGNENTEVNYSDSYQLEADLLQQKKRSLATKDAKKLYRHEGDVHNISEQEFIDNYLEENGLQPQSLSDAKSSTINRQNFINNYQTKGITKSRRKKLYYEFNSKTLEIPSIASSKYLMQLEEGDYESMYFPLLITKNNKDYIIDKDNMSPEHLNGTLKVLINESINGLKDGFLNSSKQQSYNDFLALCKRMSFIREMADDLYVSGNAKRANIVLEDFFEEAIMFCNNSKSKDSLEERY